MQKYTHKVIRGCGDNLYCLLTFLCFGFLTTSAFSFSIAVNNARSFSFAKKTGIGHG